MSDTARAASVKGQDERAGPVPRRATRLERITPRVARLINALVVPVVAVILWEAFIRAGLAPSRLIPPPSQVAAALYDWIVGVEGGAAGPFFSGTWTTHVVSSGARVIRAFLLATLIGVSLGILIGWYKTFERLFDPLIQLLRPIPVTAWIPFAIVIFGLQEMGAISLIALGAFFPIVLNTTAGAQHTPRMLVRAALMLGTKRRDLLFRVVVPAALPNIFTGLRLGLGIAWVLLIVAEMLAVRSGLGWVMWQAYQQIRMDMIVATMVSVGLLGLVTDWLLVQVRRRVLRWSEGLYQ